MTVRAKFRCTEIKRGMTTRWSPGAKTAETAEVRSIVMVPVSGNGDPEHENTKFWQASPSGSLTLDVLNLAAAEQFELGREYYLDFSVAPVA